MDVKRSFKPYQIIEDAGTARIVAVGFTKPSLSAPRLFFASMINKPEVSVMSINAERLKLTICVCFAMSLMYKNIANAFMRVYTPSSIRISPSIAGHDSYEFCVMYAPKLDNTW